MFNFDNWTHVTELIFSFILDNGMRVGADFQAILPEINPSMFLLNVNSCAMVPSLSRYGPLTQLHKRNILE